jgi:hypothetical protein
MNKIIVKGKNETKASILSKDSLKHTNKIANKASNFKPKKFQIPQDKITRIVSLNQNNEALK